MTPRLPGAPYPAFDGSQPCTQFPFTTFFPEGGELSEAERKRIRAAIGVFPQLVAVGDQETVRNRIDALDDGTRTAVEIAEQAGCNPKTVERHRAARKEAA